MGLFDMFKSDSGDKMTPHLAFATSLLYMMSADGEMDNEEVGHLLSVLGGQDDGRGTIGVGAQNQALLDSALKYRRKNSVETFLQEAAPLLSDAQKMCMLVNLIDSSLSDGNLAQVSENLTIAFSAVILALIAASITYWVVNVRRRWLAEEMLEIETLRGRAA